ncbi:hypothetical protein MKX08_004220 [Trichoderma sp. CBMAI-0020]|nr:hypothetical protein MKX08_004220 [Trichoderma sp. CBMAI-0020]
MACSLWWEIELKVGSASHRGETAGVSRDEESIYLALVRILSWKRNEGSGGESREELSWAELDNQQTYLDRVMLRMRDGTVERATSNRTTFVRKKSATHNLALRPMQACVVVKGLKGASRIEHRKPRDRRSEFQERRGARQRLWETGKVQ